LNSLFVVFGIESWKHVLGALVLPPVPLLLLILVGAWRLARRRRLGASLVVVGVMLSWLCACTGTGYLLSHWLLKPPAALDAARIEQLRARTPPNKRTAIVVLGGGTEAFAPEYRTSNLGHHSLERLRYGVWLARATGLPVAFTGGIGWGQAGTQTEAEVAERVARLEFGVALRWVEKESRDTRENATQSVAILNQAAVEHLLIVTHDWHMPRALRAFRRAADGRLVIEAAPMGLAERADWPRLAWLPSTEGNTHVRQVLHELIGLLMGA
jgi:uncharacterized SAM-binding protein YcdF (DUF218 family)